MFRAVRLPALQGKNLFWLFLFFWLCTALVYFPAYKGGFYEDFLKFIDTQKQLSLTDVLRQRSWSLYYGVETFHYCFLSLFHTRPLPWFLLFTGMHALTAISLLRFFRGLFRIWQTSFGDAVVLTGTLFWLFTPLAAETINWKACSHYMVSMILMFSILKWFTDYMTIPRSLLLAKMIAVYILSVFFLEIFYLTPVFILVLLASLQYCRKPTGLSPLKAGIRVLLPIVLIWGLYYIAFQQVTGRAMARTELSPAALFNPLVVASRYGKYIIHLYLMEYFLPAGPKQSLYHFLNGTAGAALSGLLLLGAALAGIVRMRKASAEGQLITLLFLLLLCSFVIILPMWFYEMFPYQGSRYFYLPGAMGYLLLACLIYRYIRPAGLRKVVIALYFCCNLAGTLYLVKSIREATITGNKLMDQFRWYTGDVLLLNLPEMYKGIGIIGASPANFSSHLALLRNKPVSNKIYDVLSFNMVGRWDGAHVEVLDSTRLKVTLNQYGSWWWYKGFGAANYENDLYKVTLTDNGFSYVLELKRRPDPSLMLLYQVGGDWKAVDWRKKGEQW